MTWKEIKDKIEAQGVTDDDEILYIDAYDTYKATFSEDMGAYTIL